MTNSVYFLVVTTLLLLSHGETQEENVRPNACYWSDKAGVQLALYNKLTDNPNAPVLYMNVTRERVNSRNQKFVSSTTYRFDFRTDVCNGMDTFPVSYPMFNTKSYKFRFDLHVSLNENRIASFEINLYGYVGNAKIYVLDDVYRHYGLFVKLITGRVPIPPPQKKTSAVAYTIPKWLADPSSEMHLCGIIFNQTIQFSLRFGPMIGLSKNISGSFIISLDFNISNTNRPIDIMQRHYRYSGWMYPCPVTTNDISDEYHITYPDSWKNYEVNITFTDVYTSLEMMVMYVVKNGSSNLKSSEMAPFLTNLFFTPHAIMKINGDNKHVAAYVGDYRVKLLKCGPDRNVAYLWQTYIEDDLYNEVFYHYEYHENEQVSIQTAPSSLRHQLCLSFGTRGYQSEIDEYPYKK